MDFQVSVPGPFSYLVHEHARSILAIQELQREVSSLLEFRDNVLHTLPHLHSRAQLQDRAYHSLTHDPSGGPHIPHGTPTSQAGTRKAAQLSPHHVTSSGEDVKQQRPNSSSTTSGVATTTSNSSSGNSSSSSTGGKSLSEAHNSAVADSGFSTDKAGGSMGKSSSSSAGDHLSGVDEHQRWMSVEPEMPLGSAEDELWHLLDVIQRKGTRLRHELEQAERQERERSTHPPTSSTSDPLASPRPHPAYRDYWPHSLPPTGHYPPRSDVLPPPPPPPPLGVGAEAEAWAAVERLRQDRQYLVGRVSWAEGEAAASHQRLLDLHNQLMVLAGEKRRLEEQLRGMRLDHRLDQRFDQRYDQRTVDPRVDVRNDLNLQFVKTNGVSRDGPASTGGIVHSVMGGTNTVHIMSDSSASGTTTTTTTASSSATKLRRVPSAVTVSVANSGDGQQQSPEDTIRGRVVRNASSVRIGNERDIVLPRVLKVPIKDRNKQNQDLETSPSTKDISNKEPIKESSPSSDNSKGSDRVVIERERRAPGKADGGLSMPVSLLKGGKIKVKPDKQRISAILREKDVIELQRQLLTTVMETEVLRKQVETYSEEWASKSAEFESDQRHSRDTINQLKQDNSQLKAKIEERDKVKLNYRETGTHCVPSYKSVGVMTNGGSTDSEEEPSHTVYQSPNIKYDVVVHEEETSPRQEANNNHITEARKTPPAVEKPPRKSRETSSKTASPLTWNSSTNANSPVPMARNKDMADISGRDSLGRSTTASRSRIAHSARSTPTATPRSSPAPSLAAGRSGRAASQDGGRSTPVGRSSSSISSRFPITRRDTKTGVGGGPLGGSHSGVSKASSSSSIGSGGVTGQHKDPSLLVCDETLPGQRRPIPMSRTTPTIEQQPDHQTIDKVITATYDNSFTATPRAVTSLGGNTACSSVLNPYEGKNVITTPSSTVTRTASSYLVSSAKNTTGPLRSTGTMSATAETSDASQPPQRKKLSASDLYNQDYNQSNPVAGLGSSGDTWLSQLASGGSSTASSISISSSDSFYDSITTDTTTDKLMQVEVAFDWNPVPHQEIRYLPPAAHIWTPATVADKRMPGLVSAPQHLQKSGLNSQWTKKHPFVAESQLENYGRNTSSGKIKKPTDQNTHENQLNDGGGQWTADSLEDDLRGFDAVGKMRNRLRAINGAVRVKNTDRPSVLPHNHGEKMDDHENEGPTPVSGQGQVTGKLLSSSPSSRDSANSDLNARVHQILSRIAASAQ
ncbi:unnamed protein product [Meganyctiphanes norvegica]|uniref:Uncharacterized protein n=1 Tax=Meganyctiphanes norvegica TaxID=48144 RepID=A0AAV2PTB6_MEGNR